MTLSDKAVEFINKLTLIGDYSGEPFLLRPWQEKIVRSLHETKEDGTLQYPEACLLTVRKQGKTQLAAACLLFRLLAWDSPDQELYSAASSRDQSSIIFKALAQMCRADRYLNSLVTISDYKKEIKNKKTGSVYKALASEAGTIHGLSPSMAIVDEYHVFKNSDLFDALRTGMGARRNAQLITISTMCASSQSFSHALFDYAKKVQSGEIVDEQFLAVVYALEADADPFLESNWHKVCPMLGDVIPIEYYRKLANEAKNMPSKRAAFQQYCLNQLVEGGYSWLPLAEHWEHCNTPFNHSLNGRPAFCGLDLATGTDDLSSLSLVFPDDQGNLDVKTFVFSCDADLQNRSRRDNVDYQDWKDQGYLITNPGNAVDFDFVCEEILKICKQYNVKEIGFDDWQAHHLASTLSNKGVEVVSVRQGFKSMSTPSKELERLLVTHKINFDNHPILRWALGNATVKKDDNGNIRPIRINRISRIDPAISLIMAIGRHLVNLNQGCIYNTRGMITL